MWRSLNDEKDVWEGQALENRERLLPLEHSDLNDIESSVAQKRIRQVPFFFGAIELSPLKMSDLRDEIDSDPARVSGNCEFARGNLGRNARTNRGGEGTGE